MKIAFIGSSTNGTLYGEFIPLAKLIRDLGHEVFFVIDKHPIKQICAKLAQANLKIYVGDRVINLQDQDVAAASPVAEKNLSVIKKSIFSEILSLFKNLVKFYCAGRVIQKVFGLENPDAIIVYGDRCLQLVPFAMSYMKRINRSVVDLQIAVEDPNFTYISKRKGRAEYASNYRLNSVVKYFNKEHAWIFDKKEVLFYPWYIVFALWAYRVSPKAPWLLGQSGADKYLMISNDGLEKHLSWGGKNDNAIVVGQLSLDQLYKTFNNREQIKQHMLDKYFKSVSSKNNVVVLAMPQFYEHHIFSYDKSIDESLYLCSAIAACSNTDVLVSLHPKMNVQDYLFLEEKIANLRIAKDERLSEILAIADVFVSAFESTIAWSIMCEVTPVFLDYYELGYDLTNYECCQVLTQHEALAHDIQYIIENLSHLKLKLAMDQDKLPPFDGKSGERIMEALEKTVAEKTQASAQSYFA